MNARRGNRGNPVLEVDKEKRPLAAAGVVFIMQQRNTSGRGGTYKTCRQKIGANQGVVCVHSTREQGATGHLLP